MTTPLKRTAGILFLFVVGLNLCGYRLLLHSLERQNAAAVEQRLDRNAYTDADLVSVKTTLHLPYYTGSKEFERASGSVTLNGVDYDYVKRRVYNDTLELLCLPNAAKTQLKQTGAEIAKLSAGAQPSTPQKKTATAKLSLPDFFQSAKPAAETTASETAPAFSPFADSFLAEGHTARPKRPPQADA